MDYYPLVDLGTWMRRSCSREQLVKPGGYLNGTINTNTYNIMRLQKNYEEMNSKELNEELLIQADIHTKAIRDYYRSGASIVELEYLLKNQEDES